MSDTFKATTNYNSLTIHIINVPPCFRVGIVSLGCTGYLI